MPTVLSKITFTNDIRQVFGYSEDRSSWTIFNANGASPVYWNYTRPGSVTDGFRIPANTSLTLKIPEDDPRQELWVAGLSAWGAANPLYVYEGYGGKKYC